MVFVGLMLFKAAAELGEVQGPSSMQPGPQGPRTQLPSPEGQPSATVGSMCDGTGRKDLADPKPLCLESGGGEARLLGPWRHTPRLESAPVSVHQVSLSPAVSAVIGTLCSVRVSAAQRLPLGV